MAASSGGSVVEAVGNDWAVTGQERGGGSDGSGRESVDRQGANFGKWTGARNSRARIKRKKGDENDESEYSSSDDMETASVVSVIERRQEFKVFVRLEQEGATFEDWNPTHLTKALHTDFGEVRSAKKTMSGGLIVVCKDEEQQKKAITVNKLNGKKVKCTVVFDKKLIRGVISGIPLSESISDVVGGIKNVKVKEAKRLKTKREGVLTDSLSILLTFDEAKLPDKVFIGYMSYDVRVYVPPPLRCFKCQKYGHIAAVCKGKLRCSKCSGEHEYGKCEKDAKLKCSNCGGEHSSAYRGCEVSKRMQEVQRIRVTEGMSYAQAARKVPPPRGVRSESVPPGKVTRNERQTKEVACKKCDKIKEDTLIVSKSDFVLFMAEVINCSAQTERRTKKIQIIVDAAEKYLGIVGLQWEAVRDGLQEIQQSSQSQEWITPT